MIMNTDIRTGVKAQCCCLIVLQQACHIFREICIVVGLHLDVGCPAFCVGRIIEQRLYLRIPGRVGGDRLVEMTRKTFVRECCEVGHIIVFACIVDVDAIVGVIIDRRSYVECRSEIFGQGRIYVTDFVSGVRCFWKVCKHRLFQSFDHFCFVGHCPFPIGGFGKELRIFCKQIGTDGGIFFARVGNLFFNFIDGEVKSGVVGYERLVVGFPVFIFTETPVIASASEQPGQAGDHLRIGRNNVISDHFLVLPDIIFFVGGTESFHCIEAVHKRFQEKIIVRMLRKYLTSVDHFHAAFVRHEETGICLLLFIFKNVRKIIFHLGQKRQVVLYILRTIKRILREQNRKLRSYTA